MPALANRRFTAVQVVNITGIHYSTMDYWAKLGLVRPSIEAAHGSGSRRAYSFEDLVAIRVAMMLRRAGIFGRSMVQILQGLRQAGFDAPASLSIQITPDGKASVSSRIQKPQHHGQLALNLECDLRPAATELRRALGIAQTTST